MQVVSHGGSNIITALIIVCLAGVLVKPVVPSGLLVEVRSPTFAATGTRTPAPAAYGEFTTASCGLELQSGLFGLCFGLGDAGLDVNQSFPALRQQCIVSSLPLRWSDGRVGKSLCWRVVFLDLCVVWKSLRSIAVFGFQGQGGGCAPSRRLYSWSCTPNNA